MNYWEECIKEAFDDAKITATPDQIDTVAGWVESGYENYGMAHGYDVIQPTTETEAERLKKEIHKLKKQHEQQLEGVRNGVSLRRNVDASNVDIDEDGNVTYGFR